LMRHEMTVEATFDLISSIRGHNVPENHVQREWVERLAADLAGRSDRSLVLPSDSDR
jgi:hypothetical protein